MGAIEIPFIIIINIIIGRNAFQSWPYCLSLSTSKLTIMTWILASCAYRIRRVNKIFFFFFSYIVFIPSVVFLSLSPSQLPSLSPPHRPFLAIPWREKQSNWSRYSEHRHCHPRPLANYHSRLEFMTCRLHLRVFSVRPSVHHCPLEVTATKMTSACRPSPHFITCFFVVLWAL